MKYILVAALPTFFFFCVSVVFGERSMSNRSSRTVTADSLQRLPGSNPGDILSSVMVSSCSSTPGSLFQIYDSSGQDSRQIASLHTSTSPTPTFTVNCMRQYDFFLTVSSAITYTTTNGADVTILWQNNILDRDQ